VSILEELLKIDQYGLCIKTLDISWMDGVNDILLSQLIPKYPKLERLDISNCYEVTDTGIITISTHCQYLIVLDISQCFRITANSLNQIVIHCPQLRYLNVENCDYITLDDLKLWKYQNPSLTLKAKRDLLKKLENQ